jgi:hypothetical protein
MSIEPLKYTENSFKSMADVTIDSARTKAMIDVGRKEGRSEEEIIGDVFKDDDGLEYLGRLVTITNLWKWMGEIFGLYGVEKDKKPGENPNRVFYGYLLIMQHYVDEPEAKKVQDLFDNAKTIRDLWAYFLECNDISEEQVAYIPGYDHQFFSDLLSKKITLEYGFGINREEALKKRG